MKYAVKTEKGYVEEIEFYHDKEGKLVREVTYTQDLENAKKWAKTSLNRVLEKIENGKVIEVSN